MAFKRYDGISGSAPQKKIDKGVPKCPFCGCFPHWLLQIDGGFFKSPVALCMCEKCGAVLRMESKSLEYADVVDIVDTGRVNALNLPVNQRFSMVALQNIASNIQVPVEPSYAQGANQAPVTGTMIQTKSPEFPDAVYYLDGGVGDILVVYEDRILIRHKGALNFFAMGIKGDKTVYYTDITAIQFKKAGFVAGHIQFAIMGSHEDKGGAFSAAGDENTITIGSEQNAYAEEIVNYMNSKIREFKTARGTTQVVNNVSSADEIMKFKQLLDAGIITQEEFDAKKKQLLGL